MRHFENLSIHQPKSYYIVELLLVLFLIICVYIRDFDCYFFPLVAGTFDNNNMHLM